MAVLRKSVDLTVGLHALAAMGWGTSVRSPNQPARNDRVGAVYGNTPHDETADNRYLWALDPGRSDLEVGVPLLCLTVTQSLTRSSAAARGWTTRKPFGLNNQRLNELLSVHSHKSVHTAMFSTCMVYFITPATATWFDAPSNS